jgi:hypothetical protein
MSHITYHHSYLIVQNTCIVKAACLQSHAYFTNISKMCIIVKYCKKNNETLNTFQTALTIHVNYKISHNNLTALVTQSKYGNE